MLFSHFSVIYHAIGYNGLSASSVIYVNPLYIAECDRLFPVPLIYLVLPLLLHRKTREAISTKTQFINWIHNNEYLLIDFAERSESLVTITNEALEYLLHSNHIAFSSSGEVQISYAIKSLSKTKFAEEDVKTCIDKSESIGKWFARTGRVETIYSALGVRP